MQRFFLWCAVVVLLSTTSTHAVEYPLAVTNTPTTITVTISGIPTTDTSDYELYNGTRAVGPNTSVNTESFIKRQSNGSIAWELSGLNIVPNSTYYFQVQRLPGAFGGGVVNTPVSEVVPFVFGAPTDTASVLPAFSIARTSESEVLVTGKINTALYQNGSNVDVIFSWSTTNGFTGTAEPSDRKTVQTGTNGQAQIAVDGSYTLKINSLSPSTTYYFKQTIKTSSGSVIHTKTDVFDTTNGFIAAGSPQEQEINDNKTYYLLAPWPGLSALMDPDLCYQKKFIDKTIPEDAICDVNGFLDFAFKLLIGLTAVILVLRLMFEGYQYVVTDIPFLKASAKGNFFTALLGLLLALSAYLILNTINPKLVNNTISIDGVSVGVEIVNYPDAGDDTTEANFKSGKVTYSKDATISPAVTTVLAKIKDGWEISGFKIFTNNRMVIILKKGNTIDSSNLIDVGHGINGFSNPGQARSGDKKTPIGTWKIIDVRKPKLPGQPVFNAQGSNMGAAFFHLNPMQNGERGIGMHGNKNGTLSGTNGCIRMKNADIEALLPHIKVGTEVVIGN